jgi:glycosyltransferase involved in cell wall biosynthesis
MDAAKSDPPESTSSLVSIVIPCYNYAAYLGEAVESALAQTHRPIEVLVVDDGSTDDTARVSAGYAPRGVRYHRQENAGLSAARNAGARLVDGAHLVFLDADDVLEPSYVEECLAALRRERSAGFAYTQMRLFGRESRLTVFPPYSLARLLEDNFVNASALIRAELVREHPYDTRFKTGWEDWDFYLTLAEHGVGGILVDKPLLRYRRHAGSASMFDAVARDRSLRLRMRLGIIAAHPKLFSKTARLGAWRRHFQELAVLRMRTLLGLPVQESRL